MYELVVGCKGQSTAAYLSYLTFRCALPDLGRTDDDQTTISTPMIDKYSSGTTHYFIEEYTDLAEWDQLSPSLPARSQIATCHPPALTMIRRLTNLLAVLLCLLVGPGQIAEAKKQRNAPHEHKGKLTPYSPGPFDVLKLGPKDEDALSKDKAVMKQIPGEGGGNEGGRAICIQDVNAPKEAVWNQILDLDHYVGKVNKLKECKNYFVKKNADGTSTIKTKMVVGVIPGYSYEYYCDHVYSPGHDSVTWTLDYDKLSDFDDVAGHWHLEDHPTKPGCTRVFYACDIKFKRAVPGPVMSFLTKSALKQATSWVKRESESKPQACIPKEFAVAFVPTYRPKC